MGRYYHVFGATQCAIQTRFAADAIDPTFVAEAVVVTEDPRTLRWVGGRLGPLEVRGVTESQALTRMLSVLEERFGPSGGPLPDRDWTSTTPILPPDDATSTVPVRLVWTDGSPDTLTTIPEREVQLELSVLGARAADRFLTFRLTEERDSDFRWVYKQVADPGGE